jgi:thioredoxin-like negative regulator of GroEL
VVPQDVGQEVAAARVSLVVDDEVVSTPALVKATWTDDEALSTRINREVAHYTGQAELAEMIQDGLAARRRGDMSEATKKLGRATQLAAETGNDATMKLLSTVVDVDDAETGTVRLKSQVADADEMTLDTRSTRTTRIEIAD